MGADHKRRLEKLGIKDNACKNVTEKCQHDCVCERTHDPVLVGAATTHGDVVHDAHSLHHNMASVDHIAPGQFCV
jgi:hypothetical protein